VYYWRRRRSKVVLSQHPGHVSLSLRTRDPACARKLAAYVNVAFESIMLSPQARFLTRQQITALLRTVVDTHLAKLERIAAAEKSSPDYDPTEAQRQELIVGWAYRLLETQGASARIRDIDRALMREAGLDEQAIAFVGEYLDRLRLNQMVPTPVGKLERLLSSQGAAATSMNVAQVQNIYFRGLALALFESARRHDGRNPEDADLVGAILAHDLADTAPAPLPSPPLSAAVPSFPSAPIASELSPSVQSSIDDNVCVIGESLIRSKVADGHWDNKSEKQARSLFALLDRFFREETPVRGLAALRQEHLAAFVRFLKFDVYTFYGRSENDASRSIAELRDVAAKKSKQFRGVGGVTMNRHLTALGQLLTHARAQGVPIDRDLQVRDLRTTTKKVRARNQRPKLPIEVAERIFHAAPFTGCAGWDQPLEPGDQIFHRALYFVALLLHYAGARREEICGLEIVDVIERPIPHIYIRTNSTRRIKNPQSERLIALHPEILRLGFLDYLNTLRALGYKIAFPDLFSPTTKSPLGDRFYDEFKPVISLACKEAGVDDALVIHSMRHGFNSALKAKHVREEERADLMGHRGGSETTERYADPIVLRRSLQLVKRLPIVSVHLRPTPIKLLPWVERKETAPFSRPRTPKDNGLRL
jgi:integrase